MSIHSDQYKRITDHLVGNNLNLRICVLGKSYVGKSKLILRYLSNSYDDDYDETIEDRYKICTTIENINCLTQIVDTSGSESYKSMIDSWIYFSDGFLLVYSSDSNESVEYLKFIIDKIILINKDNKTNLVIVNNKYDLYDSKSEKCLENEKHAKELAQTNNADYFDSSSLSNLNIKEPFLKLIDKVSNKIIHRKSFLIENNNKTNNKTNKDDKKCFCF